MGRYRCLYLIVLIFAIFFYVAYAPWFSWYLLVITLLFPVFDLCLSLPGLGSRRVALSAPRMLEQGETGTLSLTVTARKRLPAGFIKVKLLETTEEVARKHSVSIGGCPGSRLEMNIGASQSGFIRFETTRLWGTSLMGLFSFPLKGKGSAGVLVLPAPQKPPKTVLLPQSNNLVPKPGGGFSEERDIRGYRVGDPINSIHWKLSAKHDELIVREALMFPPHSRLVFCKMWENAAQRDLILGRLRWISGYLLERGCPYFVRLGDTGPVAEINSPEELTEYLYHVLCGETPAEFPKIRHPARFTWVFRVDAREAAL